MDNIKIVSKPILILKIGTSGIVNLEGKIDEIILESICKQIASLYQKYNILIVSSGAVISGKNFLPNYKEKIAERKAAAAIGNPILIRKFHKYFQQYKIFIGQILCERSHFADRSKFLQLRQTIMEIWKEGGIPICNENDTFRDYILRFSDNDELATLFASGFFAQKLLFGSSVNGVLDSDGNSLDVIDNFSEKIFNLISSEKSAGGLGGMLSKLHWARLATYLGIDVQIFDIRIPNNIIKAELHQSGTHCISKPCDISLHKKWIATGSLAEGNIVIDQGAADALFQSKNLLLVGVKNLFESWEKGDIIKIYLDGNHKKSLLAIARSRLSAKEMQELLEKKDYHGVIVARTDDLVLMQNLENN